MILIFDPFNGISGDMTVGALVDAGLPLDYLEETYHTLQIGDLGATAAPVLRAGIRATRFQVHCSAPRAHRHLSDIERMIDSASLSARARQWACMIFRRLAEAEAEVHGTAVERVHFHEVGALDSIADIVGAAAGFDYFGIDQFFSSAINVGFGTLCCDHGVLPVPAPATALLLREFATFAGTVQSEMTTPTGAAIVSALAQPVPAGLPAVRQIVGYGAGERDFPETPNALRIFLAEELKRSRGEEEIIEIQANIDDMNPQLYAPLFERLLADGALDVFYQPVVMKQGRPGILLTLLCRVGQREKLSGILFRETTTLGVRYQSKRREILNRAHLAVETPYGPVRVKVAASGPEVLNYAAEFEDCQKLAEAAGVPVKEVYNAAMAAYREKARERG